jgi:hypothetical protein
MNVARQDTLAGKTLTGRTRAEAAISESTLAELTLAESTLPIPGTRLCWVEHLPEHLPDAVSLGRHVEFTAGEVLVTFPGLARYRVSGGQSIEVMLLPGGTRDVAEFFLMATPFGALIHQRGELPLHAAAVVPPDGAAALLISGESGAGKSTTAAALARRGWRVLADDVSRVDGRAADIRVWPGFTALKLWQQSCEMLALDSTRMARTRGEKEKYFWHPPTHDVAVPIVAMVELLPGDAGGTTSNPARTRGAATLQVLLRQTFRRAFVRPMGCQASHFSQMQAVAGRMPVYQVDNSHAVPPDVLVDRLLACVG